MAYSSVTDIQQDFKQITFASGYNITDTQITEFIVESDALINSYVGSIYVVPVTAGDGLNLLKLMSRSLTVSRVKKIMAVKQAKSTDANQDVTDVLLTATAVMKMLRDIQSKVSILAGATLLDAQGGFYNNNVAKNVCPKIHKNHRQW